MINKVNSHAASRADQQDADRLRLQGWRLHVESVAAARYRQIQRRKAAINRRLITNVALDAVLIGAIVTALTVVAACCIGGA